MLVGYLVDRDSFFNLIIHIGSLLGLLALFFWTTFVFFFFFLNFFILLLFNNVSFFIYLLVLGENRNITWKNKKEKELVLGTNSLGNLMIIFLQKI